MLAASTFIRYQKIAECGDSAAAFFNISANDRSLYHMNESRSANGASSLRTSSNQSFSPGEVPSTQATVFVFGNTCRMFSMRAGKFCAVATTTSFSGPLMGMVRPCSCPDQR